MEAFKAFIKPFGALQRSLNVKIEVNFLSTGNRTVSVQDVPA